MGVLIKGMKIPKSCGECIFDVWGACLINLNTEPKNKLTHSCPLIEIPDHGDLIDRDALMARYAEEVKPSNNSDFMRPPRWNDAVQLAELAPVVIPAERSEE